MALVRALNYYGSKVSSAKRYPAPTRPLIIEPFAGGAGYSLRYRSRDIALFDCNPEVAAAWKYLILTPAREIMALPLLMPGDAIPLELPEAARLLIGWCCMIAGAHPQSRLPPSAARVPSSFWGESRRAKLASLSEEIRHWRVECADYTKAPQVDATWFIDPPYAGAKGTPYAQAKIEYGALAEWCRSRSGQVIVCEAAGANWLPFAPLHQVRAQPRPGAGRPLVAESVWVG